MNSSSNEMIFEHIDMQQIRMCAMVQCSLLFGGKFNEFAVSLQLTALKLQCINCILEMIMYVFK